MVFWLLLNTQNSAEVTLMKFRELLESSKIDVIQFWGDDLLIGGISQDSRNLKASDLFIVIPNQHDVVFFKQALECGVRAFVLEESTYKKIQTQINLEDVSLALVCNARLALAHICGFFFNKQPNTCVAVTGTNGKSSVVHFVQQIFNTNQPSASLGTLGLKTSTNIEKQPDIPSLTTLDSVSLHRVLNFLSEHDINFLAMEASSHGIEQYRLHGVNLKAAAFTNLTQDHLDYHKTMDNYFLAKARLFTEILPPKSAAVIFKDNAYSKQLLELCKTRHHRVIQYSTHESADVFASNISYTVNGIITDLNIQGKTYKEILIPLIGAFQLENVLCAIGLSLVCGMDIQAIVNILPTLQNVKGRMESVGSYKDASVFVDYAHTPDALERVLIASRLHTDKQLGVVFGCGGDRDPTKRALMGKIAQKYADFVVVTDDNPRSEDPAKIRQEILQNCPKGIDIGNRAKAIETGLELLHKGDILIIAGKGHETGQIVGDFIHPFDDAVCVLNYLKREK